MNNNTRPKILLVEDEALIAMGEAAIIEKYGFSVMMAYSGSQAIEMARANPDLDLILMDIDLGQGLDGTQTAAQILEFRELPIVFLTGHAEKEMVDKVKKITRYGYVLKNSGEFVLIESINMAFELFEAHQRAKAENQKLQASERKFRTMYQFSRAGIARLGLDKRIEQANPTYCRMLGYTEAELVGKSISDITHPDDLPENLEKQGRLGRGEIENFTIEKRFIHKDGHPVYGLLNANVVQDHEGNPEYFLGNVVDITDRRNAEEALRQSESFHQILLSNISDSIFITDKQGKFIYVCPNVEHNFGYSYQEVEQIGNINQLLGNHIFDPAELKKKGELINIERTAAIKGGEQRTFLINVKPILSGTLYICRDITDRKQTDKLLKTHEKFNKAILDSVTAHIAVLNKDGVIIAVNEAWREFAAENGLSPEVGLGENYFNICQPAQEAAGAIEGMKTVLSGEKDEFSIEYPCHSPEEKRWFWLHAVPLQSDEGGLVVSHINITDHKKAVRELHRYKHIVRASPDGLSLVDRDYYYRAVSDEYLRRTNKQRHEIEGRSVAEVMGQIVFDNIVKPELDRCFNGETVRYQKWFDFAGSGWRFVDVTYTPYRGDEQTISGAVVGASDITELAEMQEQADQQQRALRALVDAAFDSALLIKPDGEIIECNQTVADRFGKERQSLLGTNTFSLMDPKTAEYRQARANRVIETGQPVQFEDVRHGRDIKHAINPMINDRGEVEALAVFSSDITKQKQAAITIQESEARQRAILQAIPDLMFVLTVDGQILDFKASHTEDLVLKPEEVINSYIQESFPPDITTITLQSIKNAVETNELQILEYKLPVQQGIQDFEARLVRLDPDTALAIVRNVTHEKQMAQARRDSEEKFRLLYENMAQGAFYQQADGTHLDINPAALEIFGLSRDEFLDRTSLTPEWRVIREDGSDFTGEQHPSMEALKTGQPVRNTIAGIYNPRRDDYVWVNINAIPQFRPGEDKPYQVIVTLHDITARKLAEQSLRDRKERLKQIIQQMPYPVEVFTPDGTADMVNQAFLDMFSIPQADLVVGKYNAFEDQFLMNTMGLYRDVERAYQGEVVHIPELILFMEVYQGAEQYLADKDKTIIQEVTMFPVFDQSGDIWRVVTIWRDITEQKQAEQALRESNEKYRTLTDDVLETSSVGIFILDADFKIIWINQAMEQFFGVHREEMIGQNKSDLIGQSLKNLMENPEEFSRRVLATYENNTYSENFECHVLPGPNREERWLEHWSQPIRSGLYAGGRIEHYTDITGRKQAEARIQTLLNEKELLLREIHHRIKNDMAAISSILQLHATASDNPDTTQALIEARRRLNILSNIYEKLYTDEDFKKIPLQPLLNDLIADIIRTHAAAGLTVETNIEALPVTAKQSFHLGIIINELVTNACKYAFPDNNWGKIAISVRQADENHLEITVSDDGVGFSFQNTQAKREGFGCTLIKAMVAQYNGSVEIMPEDGTTVTILMKYMT